MAVAKHGDEPVAVADAARIHRARGAALAVVVLGTAVDIVERRIVVDRDLVELRDGQVVDEAPRRAEVEALVNAAIGADQQVVRIVVAESERVMIAVLGLMG